MKASLRALVIALASTGGASAEQTPDSGRAPTSTGMSHIKIVGNYAGKNLKLLINDLVLAERVQHLLPPGVSWQLATGSGPARRVMADLKIEPCPDWRQEILLAPDAVTTIIVRDCKIEALAPE